MRDFNRVIYHLYDRCLRTSPCATDALLMAEQQLVDTFAFVRPPGFNPRVSIDARQSTRSGAHQMHNSRVATETQGLSVVALGEQINFPGENERQRSQKFSARAERTSTARPDSSSKKK
ncbi:unnamed protein product [Echinostoma caproni]|uniref:Uncharacterized protein n=1 Tax=Echinostoma caproni TaxID=27848 RepID=A0A3P8GLA3_9TREM|nr:unnamed protein product [Echinostoma caproni]